MIKQVDVDTLLAENELELTLAGRKFKVKDVPMTTFLETAKGDMEKDKDLLHKQLASILGVDIEDVKNVGLRATGLALNAVREWLTDTAPDVESDEESDIKSKKGTGASKAKNA